ncbi:methyltransferase domain-containing protein [Macrococcoides bohemicum]|uniref:methyltransferase domain-containing protein n=1 Tax=Macrococcoides bohemicum TaxID=1903056 RepID=UPI001C5F718A|nr:methyltransferase domain-containing protein [Macrococcus bohemicus]QYA45674.1 methyltransferase domain-containing protein [Macrococcus bohemicus]
MEVNEKKLISKWEKKIKFLNRTNENLFKAKNSDLIFVPIFEKFLGNYVTIKYHQKVLCIGCHTGKWVNSIDQQTNIKGYILDQSIRNLQTSMHIYPHFNYEIASSNALPYKDKKFHYILINQPFDTFLEKEELIKEFQRIIKKKGKIILYYKSNLFFNRRQQLEKMFEAVDLQIENVTHYRGIEIYEIKNKGMA